MTRKIIAIRPEPGLGQTIAAARDMDLEIYGEALFEASPIVWECPDADGFDGLLIGSANALRFGGPALTGLLDLPVYAVGETTAKFAAASGFEVAQTGMGGLQRMLDRISVSQGNNIRLLRLAGEERVSLTPPSGILIEECVVYRMASAPLSGSMRQRLAEKPLVLLHSAAAATHFRSECERCGIDRSNIALATLGPRISDAAGDGWEYCVNAEEPTDAALLALARKLCH